MESAIDKHLQCPRTLSRRIPDHFQPPFPMYAARAKEDLTQVVMGYYGVQCKGDDDRGEAFTALRHIVASFGIDDGPGEYDTTHHEDSEGYDNLIAVGYWRDPDAFHRWSSNAEVAGWWDSDDRVGGDIGFFREVVSPRADQFETIYAFTDNFPGVGAIMDGVSDEIQEHSYWGSMRERVPLSQTDRMIATGHLAAQSDPTRPGRVIVRSHDNVALIRSGQDWVDTHDAERELYLTEIEPVLRKGMDFLRDSGQDIGCYSNRFVRYIDLNGNPIDKTYNIGHWRSIEHLERWAESHSTHLRIFVTFFRVIDNLDKLRLYHEMSVFDAKAQYYEYINCHPATGLLRDAATTATV